MSNEEGVSILVPVDEPDQVEMTPTSRLDSLDGKVMGLLDNHRTSADVLLSHIERLLSQRYSLGGIMQRQKPDDGTAASDELINELAQHCHFVVNAVAA